jgi:formylglycine-generating enzyme required for sulfatase activity
MPTGPTFTNSIGMKFVRIESGELLMGFEGEKLSNEIVTKKSHFTSGDFDEHPRHKVKITSSFHMAATEVTNAQYELFSPEHRSLRGRMDFSKDDNEAVIFVNWYDAQAFCQWLSDKEGLPYRLPTEAEWEYACRAGTTTPFNTGFYLPESISRGYAAFNKFEPADLTVGQSPPNKWGLYDMHGNVEEWCRDWYGPYKGGLEKDPVGRINGDFKVIRGGSHSTVSYYLRSANRMGTIPDDRQWLTGFRIVLGSPPRTTPLPEVEPQPYQLNVSRKIPDDIRKGPDPEQPYFKGPNLVVKIPRESTGPLYGKHGHFMALTDCPNGDLLAAWFTGMHEQGRELSVAASRLRYGQDRWQKASLFWDAPDRNDHAHALWHDGKGTIYHFNGLGVRFRNLAILLRKSTDNAVTWSRARLIFPDHDTARNTVVESVFRAQDGQIILPIDGPSGGSVIALSNNNGISWEIPDGLIRGTHAGVVQLKDGRLMAFGRHGAIDGMMPKSISSDMGKSWSYAAGPFNSIHTGRRLALKRLTSGALFLASFASDMEVHNNSGKQHTVNGLFAALSYDDGKTWPHVRLLVGDGNRREIRTMSGDAMTIDGNAGELYAYLAARQTPDGIVHVISSRNHYAFNEKWIKTLPSPPPLPLPEPTPKQLKVKKDLPDVYEPKGQPSKDNWRWELFSGNKESDIVSTAKDGVLRIHTNDKQSFYFRADQVDGFAAVDSKTGFTAEIKTQIIKHQPNNHGVAFELYDGAGCRYAITITGNGIYWYQGTVRKSAFLPFSEYKPLRENIDNTSGMHTYRLAVRPDRIVQIYRDGELLGTRRSEYRTPRFAYIFFGASTNTEALIDYISFDLTGPYSP